MFRQIFLFEINYRLQRPAFYIYFLLLFTGCAWAFASGEIQLMGGEFINAPAALALFSSMASIFLMLVSSSIMGVPLYRDIEHNTKEYYLSYPITKAGYFWGRFLGSFFFVALIGLAVFIGAWVGTMAGPALGWQPATRYGPNLPLNYLYPYFTIVIPSLFFTSALFFGLVAIFKNVKVIYSSGLFLFLGYLFANFALHNTRNETIIFLADPFCVNGLGTLIPNFSPARLNGSVIHLEGLFGWNRVLWTGIGATIIGVIYFRFSFERFFSGPAARSAKDPASKPTPTAHSLAPTPGGSPITIRFNGPYFRHTLSSLTRIELQNIIRDNYFWMIISGALLFLSMIFWHGPVHYGVGDLPRTAFFMQAFSTEFTFFLFLILLFYTGETVHREKFTRYSLINDALPPPTWVFNSAKLISLFCLATFLSFIPFILGLSIQAIKGFSSINLPLYFSAWITLDLPKLICIVLLSYTIHITVDNKFAAHGIGITLWTAMTLSVEKSFFTYRLLLYSFTPGTALSDMDGVGHMAKPISWFNIYWLVAGALLVVLGSLFYARGVSSSRKEKMQLASQRFHGTTRLAAIGLFIAFLAIGSYLYYNVSYLNEYLTPTENIQRSVLAEKTLKRYENLPRPEPTRVQVFAELYPDEKKEVAKTILTIRNKTDQRIDSLLLDADNLTAWTLKYNGQELSYTSPLFFPRGRFNLFRSRLENSGYRLYRLPSPLLPGDTAWVEVNATIEYKGFRNDLYARNLLDNGTVLTGVLPGLGYDDDEELSDNDTRKKYGLPVKFFKEVPQNDPEGRVIQGDTKRTGNISLDITVGTSGDQTAIAPGTLVKDWTSNGRRYFHYVQYQPLIPQQFVLFSARYVTLRDTVQLSQGPVGITIFYDPHNTDNISSLMAAGKDLVRFGSQVCGPYPFSELRIIESGAYGPQQMSLPGMIVLGERLGWNADLHSQGQLDYLYYEAARLIARQWWQIVVTPNNTVGSPVITDGLSRYMALHALAKKYGEGAAARILQEDRWNYQWFRRSNFYPEHNLVHANSSVLGNNKAEMVLYGLSEMGGADSLNAALHEFQQKWAFRDHGPYPGTDDLYETLQSHVPDSLRYYLTDTWERVSLYDNKILEVTATPISASSYKLRLKVEIGKQYQDSSGKWNPAPLMNDYIDLAVYGKVSKPLYSRQFRFTKGIHNLELTIPGKPESVRIDPQWKLYDPIDRNHEKRIE